jgi:hypothetical protein
MSSEGALDRIGADIVVERPWSHLSTDQLLDRLEWAYGETGGFEPEVVWELARRVPRDA